MSQERGPSKPGELSRRQMVALLIAAGTGGGAWRLLAGGQQPPTSHAALSANAARQQQLLNQELSATATAGAGSEMVGDAIGVMPEKTLQATQAATGIVIVVFEDLSSAQGTAAFVTSEADRGDGSRLLLTAAHVATDAGAQSTREIYQVWFGRPHVDSKMWMIERDGLSVATPQGYVPTDLSRDICAIRILPGAVPHELKHGGSLEIGSVASLQQDAQLMIAGYAGQFVGYQGNAMRASSLDVSMAPVVDGPYGGVVTVRSEQGHGSSGGPLVTASGEVAGVNVSGVSADRSLELVATAERANGLIAATWQA